jgi:lipopolysaccharide export system protein LptA
MRNNRLITSCIGVATTLLTCVVGDAQAPGGPRAQVSEASPTPAEKSLFAEDRTEKAEPPAKKAKGPTEIVALEATFDQKTHMAVFTGDVVVTDPEFNVQSDKLTAYLKHDDDKPAADAPPGRLRAPGAPAEAKSGKPAKKSSGLEKAVAEANPGNVVTVTQEKKELDGTVNHSIGHGKKVVFDSVTGDITLTGRPDVQQGLNTCVASDENTVMVLNRDGHMRVNGPHKTVIRDQADLAK